MLEVAPVKTVVLFDPVIAIQPDGDAPKCSWQVGCVVPMPTLPTTVMFDAATFDVDMVVSIAVINVTVVTFMLQKLALLPVKLDAVIVPETFPPDIGR